MEAYDCLEGQFDFFKATCSIAKATLSDYNAITPLSNAGVALMTGVTATLIGSS